MKLGRKKIIQIHLAPAFGREEIYKVGGPYIEEAPERGTVTKIVKRRGSYDVYNERGGRTIIVDHYVDKSKTVYE